MGTHLLDDDQRMAVESTAPFTLVAAGAGSGKTRCLVARITHLIDRGIDPRSIIAITFTNAGAREIAKRLGDVKLGYVGTLHGRCFGMLQRYGGLIGYREGGINMLSADLAEELLAQTAKDLRYKGSAKALKEARDPLAQLCHKEYRHRLKRSNLVDYDGVLVDALVLLKKEGGCVAGCWTNLLIDEAQDSAEIDWDIYESITAESRFVVGDEKQSIYGFRGAYPQGFTEAAAHATVIKLQRNYRSGRLITEAATRLIQHNPGLIASETISATGTEGEISYSQFSTDALERTAISMEIYNGIHLGRKPSDIAILCRTNYIAQQFRDSLLAAGVPVRSSRDTVLPQGFAHAMDVLSLFADPRSDILAERVLKHISSHRMEEAKALVLRDGAWLSAAAFGDKKTTSGCHLLAEILPHWDVDKETCDLIQQRIDLLPQPEPTLTDLRHDLFYVAQYGTGDREAKESGVMATTVHKAKGSEWDVVFVVGLEQEYWPGRDSIEEARRLLFVACTRAKSLLHLSSSASRVLEWGGVKPRTVSKFIAELGI